MPRTRSMPRIMITLDWLIVSPGHQEPLDSLSSMKKDGNMMTSSNGNIFRVTGPLCGEFIGYRWIPLTKASDAKIWWVFYLRLNKRLSKQSRRWWIETPSCPLWRHCNEKSLIAVLRNYMCCWYDFMSPNNKISTTSFNKRDSSCNQITNISRIYCESFSWHFVISNNQITLVIEKYVYVHFK